MRCDQCKFFMALGHDYTCDVDYGECRRFPPVVVRMSEYAESYSDWNAPIVQVSNWCGEFQPTDQPAEGA